MSETSSSQWTVRARGQRAAEPHGIEVTDARSFDVTVDPLARGANAVTMVVGEMKVSVIKKRLLFLRLGKGFVRPSRLVSLGILESGIALSVERIRDIGVNAAL